MIPVRSKALIERSLKTCDRELTVSLCPFFDMQGRIPKVMLLNAEDDRIRFFNPEAVTLALPVWGAVQIDVRWADLDEPAASALSQLWHYDAAWLLRETRYAHHALTPAIVASNCVNLFKPHIDEMLYDRSLTKVAWLASPSEGWKKFKPDSLPQPPIVAAKAADQAPHNPARSGRSEWRLSPIWER